MVRADHLIIANLRTDHAREVIVRVRPVTEDIVAVRHMVDRIASEEDLADRAASVVIAGEVFVVGTAVAIEAIVSRNTSTLANS